MSMDSLKNEMCYLKVRITGADKDKAKVIAKSKGMTFAGWLGMVVRDAMQKEMTEVVDER